MPFIMTSSILPNTSENRNVNMTPGMYSCFQPQKKLLVGLIALSAPVVMLIMYKSEQIHARLRGEFHVDRQTAHLVKMLPVNGRIADLNKHRNHNSTIEVNLERQMHGVSTLDLSTVSRHTIGHSAGKTDAKTPDATTLELVTRNHSEVKQACVVPQLQPFDKSIQWYIRKAKPLKCRGTMLTKFRDRELFLKKLFAKTKKYTTCYMSTIDRVSDFKSTLSSPSKRTISLLVNNSKVATNLSLKYNMSSDFTAVYCPNNTIKEAVKEFRDGTEFDTFFRKNRLLFDFHAGVVPKSEVLQRLQDIKPAKDGLGVNVVLLVLESTSRMNFLRFLPKTGKLLKELNSVVLEGYNIVADGTKGALIPILTGKTEKELPPVRKRKRNSTFVDAYPMIWTEFARNGYATMYAEDSPDIATFNYQFKGFDKQPTDHYMRTLWNEVTVTGPRNPCLGPKPVHKVMLDYLSDYINEYRDKPHFAMSFLVVLTHDNINRLKLMDADLNRFLNYSKRRGLLNNTILLMFGDHGSRYTSMRQSLQGKLEERLPFMSITLPSWMRKRHHDVIKNLQTNAKRLTTPFDIHETLRSIIHYRKNQPVNVTLHRGISLFNQVPAERTCEHAGIAPHWCACLDWEIMSLQNNEEIITTAAQTLINFINKKTEAVRDECAKLQLMEVLHAERIVPNNKVLRFVRSLNQDTVPGFSFKSNVHASDLPTVIRITLKTKPGYALYEGTVRVPPKDKDLNSKDFKVTGAGDISRINAYGKQANCILQKYPSVSAYCFCRSQ